MTIATQIENLRAAYGSVERMSEAHYEKLAEILDRADDATILVARDAGIKFVSSLARNRAIRRGL